MTENLRRVFATALPDEEPPVTTQATDLAARGRRKHRRRRAGYAVSGATFAVAGITAVALILPVTAAEPPNDEVIPPGGADGTGQESSVPADLPTLSEQTRAAMKSAFPDVKFTMASGWAVGDAPFELTEAGSGKMPYLVGYANIEGEGHELVGVELYSPGDFSSEASDQAGGDRDADEYLIDCGSKETGDTRIIATCDDRKLDDGTLLRNAKVLEKSDGKTVGLSYTSVAYRTDDTAIVLRTECHDEGDEFACDKKGFDTVGEDAVEQFLVSAPKIPHDW